MPTQNDNTKIVFDFIQSNLALLRMASDQAKKSAQSAGAKIKEVEKKDLSDIFDKKFQKIANQAGKSLNRALEDLILEGESFKSVFKQLGSDLLRNVLNNIPYGNIGASILPFARGGVLHAPTLFPLGRGAGLAGEAGPEAILPLARSADGKLGVRAQNGHNAGMQINVNITTPDVQGFHRSQTQVAGMLRRAVMRGQRNI